MAYIDRWNKLADENIFIQFVDAVLRGCGQVMFQNNPVTGLIFFIAIFYNSLLLGSLAVLGCVVSTLTGMLLGVPRGAIRGGLYGFNGVLAGIAFGFFFQYTGWVVLYAIIAAAFSSIIMATLGNFLGKWDVPALTAPFVFSTWLLLFSVFQFNIVTPSGLISPAIPNPAAQAVVAGISSGGFANMTFKGIAEVMFEDNLITGILFFIAVLINSRISFVFAVAGSVIGGLTAIALGASTTMVTLGLFGFNSVLTGIALGGVFYVIDWKSTLYTIWGIIVTAIVMAAITVALQPIGMPALTAPFVFTTWIFLFAKTSFAQLKSVPLEEVTTAELIRKAAKESK